MLTAIFTILSIGTRSVLHPDGGTRFVVQVDQEVVIPSLADDLGAVQGVNVVGSVHDLVGTDTVGVIHELQERLPAVAAHLLELAAVPSEVVPVEGGGVADGVVGCSPL